MDLEDIDQRRKAAGIRRYVFRRSRLKCVISMTLLPDSYLTLQSAFSIAPFTDGTYKETLVISKSV